MRNLFLLLTIVACGKNVDQPCLSRYQKIMQCYQDYNQTHAPYYVERVCGDKYPTEGCYK